MFRVQSNKWTGLAKLSEEAGELIQVFAKMVQTQGDSAYYEDVDLKDRLQEEVADLKATLEYFLENNQDVLDMEYINRRVLKKKRRFYKWKTEEKEAA